MSDNHVRYNTTVNALWGMHRSDVPKPTPQEAIAGCRLLLREGFRFYGMMTQAKRKRTFKITSGNRHTWPRGGVWYVNPNERNMGWTEIVHSVGHWCHGRKYPNVPGHDISHAAIERHLIEYVIKNGWLDGKLKREPRPKKPKPPVVEVRAARVLTNLKRWEAKRKRAETAIKKLKRQHAYYEKKVAA